MDPFADLRLRPVADLQPERDVLEHGHVLEGGVVLEDEADAALLRRGTRHVLLCNVDRPAVGLLQAGDDPQQRRLAAAAGPEQRDERAGRHFERHVVESNEVAEALGHVLDGDGHYKSGLVELRSASRPSPWRKAWLGKGRARVQRPRRSSRGLSVRSSGTAGRVPYTWG